MNTRFLMAVLLAAFLYPVSSFAQKNSDPEGYLTYSLPSTVIVLEVEAEREDFYAGPYAAYAEKYLGIKVDQKDHTTYKLKSIRMTPFVEADQDRRYSVNVPKGRIDASFLKFSSQGLISFADARFGDETLWRFPVTGKGDFSDKGVSSNFISEEAVLYSNGKKSVRQGVLVEKTTEKKAAEMAQKVLDVREERYKIVVGDTDATYSGEALGAAIEELTRLEKEYLSLFVGYTETQTQMMNFDVVPQPGDVQKYIAFRLSDTAGLVPADNLSGKPILLEITSQKIADTEVGKAEMEAAAAAQEQLEQTGKAPKAKTPAEKKVAEVHYRVPAICTVKIKDGIDLLLQSRIPVYQLGKESSFPVNVIL